MSPSPPRRSEEPAEYWCGNAGSRLRAHVWHEDRPGLPIVFLNGIGSSLEIIAPLAEQFPERRFIAIEMPGSGQTPATDMPLPPAILARLAMDAAESLGARSFDLIGLSLGGLLAQQVALQYRKHTARLVLIGTCSGYTMLPHDLSEDSLLRTFNPLWALVQDVIRDMNGPHFRHLMPPTANAMANQLASFTGWSSLPFLSLISTPTLVLSGTRDRIVAPANTLQLAAFIPGADHRILPEAGHLFVFTEPERAASHIRRFFTQTDIPGHVNA